jgi:tRNA(Ile)-lysidine synthase
MLVGIQTQVVKIAWGTYGQPADLPNFESVARKLRFQVLGRACRDSEIDSLFLAHHQDDQVETVMMRMINGHRMFGLMGMKRDSEIPECHGIHGVHESDGLDTVISQTVAESRSPLSQAPQSKYGFMGPLMTETGGIRVYRPLLGFTKDRLTATCKAANMKWFEDHTNKDPTVTTRNAIRHMYSSHTVPAALTSPSLLNLSEKFEARYNMLLKEANTYLEGAVKTFETRTGTMSIRFPDLDHLSGSRSPSDIKLVAALLLQQVIRFVTPEKHVHLHSLHGAVDRVLPETSKDTPFPKSTAFTVSGVQFRPLHASAAQEGTDKKCEWLISRQPYASTLSNRPNIEISPSPSNSSAEHLWTPWSLYDGRFWIRAQNRCAKLIAIRPFQKEDLASFKQSLEKEKHALLRDVLKKLAPGDVRWTLPAIVVRETDGRERILALPTLDVIVPHVQEYVSWVIRYKKVDMERLEGRGSKNESI